LPKVATAARHAQKLYLSIAVHPCEPQAGVSEPHSEVSTLSCGQFDMSSRPPTTPLLLAAVQPWNAMLLSDAMIGDPLKPDTVERLLLPVRSAHQGIRGTFLRHRGFLVFSSSEGLFLGQTTACSHKSSSRKGCNALNVVGQRELSSLK
jgi:hypothetical protein